MMADPYTTDRDLRERKHEGRRIGRGFKIVLWVVGIMFGVALINGIGNAISGAGVQDVDPDGITSILEG